MEMAKEIDNNTTVLMENDGTESQEPLVPNML